MVVVLSGGTGGGGEATELSPRPQNQASPRPTVFDLSSPIASRLPHCCVGFLHVRTECSARESSDPLIAMRNWHGMIPDSVSNRTQR